MTEHTKKHKQEHAQEPGAALTILGAVATITLNQPAKHNAFDDGIIQALLAHLDTIRNTDTVRVMLLKAEGKNFCAGADLAWMKRMAGMSYEENQADARQLARLMLELNTLPIPTIARAQGAAYGGAIGLIACCDIAFASDDAKFCLSEVKLGLAPATIGPFVVDAMGARRCRKLFLTGEVFTAKQAYDFDLIHEVVALDKLDEAVAAATKAILKTGPCASKAAKQLIFDIQANGGGIQEKTSQLIAKLRVSEEGQEGLGAFFEKRSPSWI